jgi:integrase
MASVSTDAAGNRRILFYDEGRHRRAVYVGKLPLRATETLRVKVEAIVASRLSGQPMPDEVSRWIATAPSDIKRKLVNAGLLTDREKTDPKLLEFVDSYIATRADVKPGTRTNHLNTRNHLASFFGPDRRLSSITTIDADQWRAWMLSRGKAENTVRATAKNAKLFLNSAVKAGLLSRNPFSGLRSTLIQRPDRQRFVTLEEAQKLLNACPSADWRCLVALCRFGGLRSPSETLLVKWEDINWEHSTIHVRSPKTERHPGQASRQIPLFVELREILWAAAETSTSEYVVGSIRDARRNLRTQFSRIILRAGLLPWEKPFQNLRSSRETELAAQDYPLADVVRWLGNTPEVALRHYLQPSNGAFGRATREPTPTGRESNGNRGSSSTGVDTPAQPCVFSEDF